MNLAAPAPSPLSTAVVPTIPLLIGGEFVESRSTQWRYVVNPATQAVLARVPFATSQELDAAVASLSQARAALNYSDPGSWDSAKNNLHTAWQNAQDAYAKVRASGN